jgi:hypothetical protein
MAKIRLVEKILVQIDKSNIETYDKPILFESEGQSLSKLGKLKNVPVTKYTPNLNNRVYPQNIWKQVQESGVFEGSFCRADHPADTEDGSVKDITGIWSNFQVKEDVATADLTVIGQLGKNMLDIVSAGGKLGFSTVGLGSLSETDNSTVTDYQYENTDWVMVPSQQVFATKENLGENLNISVNNLKEITNNNKIICDNIIQEKKEKEVISMTDKIQEIAFKNQINRTIKESKKKENIIEAIDDLSVLVIPETMIEEQVAVKNAISALQEKLESSKNQIQEKYTQTETSFNELKEKYDVQSKMLESMKSKFQKIDTLVKSHGLNSISDIETMKESLTAATGDIKVLAEEKTNLLSDLKVVMAERVDMLKDIKVYAKKEKIAESEKTKLMKQIEKMQEELKYDTEYIKILEGHLKKEGYKIQEIEDAKDDEEKKDDEKADEEIVEADETDVEDADAEEDDAEEKTEACKKKESKKRKKGDFSHLREEDDTDEEIKDDEEMTEEDDSDEDADEEKIEEADDSDEEKKDDEDDPMAAVRAAKESRVKQFKKIIKEEDKKDDDDTTAANNVDSTDGNVPATGGNVKAEAYKKSLVKKELTEYFNAQVKSFPGIKDFKEQIVNSKSFMDAAKKIEKIKESKQEQVKFSEARLETTWIPKGRK